MANQRVSFFLFILLCSTGSLNAEPMSVNQEIIDRFESNKKEINNQESVKSIDSVEVERNLGNESDESGRVNEPKTVFEAVVRQLEQNEKAGALTNTLAKTEKNDEKEIQEGEIEKEEIAEKKRALAISSALSKAVSEAVSEDTTERLPREKAIEENVSEKITITGKQLEDKKSKQATNVTNGKKQANQTTKVAKKKSKLTPEEMLTANFIMHSQKGKTKRNSGWVYLGDFVSNDWISRTLDINKTLPEVGRNYTVMHSLNMRKEAPTNEGAAELIKKLEKYTSVKILKVRPSGRNGHYWAQVEY